MKTVLVLFILSLANISFGQSSGTITITKERPAPRVKFAGKENGAISLRGFLIDKCLESTIGGITHFEIIIEGSKNQYMHIEVDSCCLNGTTYEQLEELGNGSQLEFINILGVDANGNEIIYPGMKFVIRKKKRKLD